MRYAAICMALFFVGCPARPAPTTVVPLSQISPDLMQVAQKALPNVKFDSARKIQVNGEDVFEIRGKMPSGKIREVEVSVSGRVVDVE